MFFLVQFFEIMMPISSKSMMIEDMNVVNGPWVLTNNLPTKVRNGSIQWAGKSGKGVEEHIVYRFA